MPDSNPFGFREQTFEQIIKELRIDGIESHLDLRVALERAGVSASHPLCLRLIQESESFFAAVQPFFKVCKDHAVLGEMKRNLGPDGRIHNGVLQNGGISAFARSCVKAEAGSKFLVCSYNEKDLRHASHSPENKQKEETLKSWSPWKVSMGVKTAMLKLAAALEPDIKVVATSWNGILLEGAVEEVEDFIEPIRQQMRGGFYSGVWSCSSVRN